MLAWRITITSSLVILGLVASMGCSNRRTDDDNGRVLSTIVTEAEATKPACPTGTVLLCAFTNIDMTSGAPRPSNQCSPLIKVTLDAESTSFTWSSPSGQRVDGVVVAGAGGAYFHRYDPAVSSDMTPLFAAPLEDGGQPMLGSIRFCIEPAASEDAGASPDAAPSPDAASGGKTW